MAVPPSDFSIPTVVPLTRRLAYYHYTQFAQQIQDRVITELSSRRRPLTESDINGLRRETNARIAEIRRMEAIVDTHRGPEIKAVEDRLFFSRVEFRARFGFIFRINDLPVEILANIFRLIAWSSPAPAASVNWRLWLTWVCRLWRNVAIADATIWNAIWFRERPPFHRSFQWFQRAETTPLDIRINDSNVYKFDSKTISELLDKVFVKLGQIRILIVIVDGVEPAQTVFEKLQTIANRKCPMILERLEVHSHIVRVDDSMDAGDSLPLFGGAFLPSLKYVSLNSVYFDWYKSQLTNLTTLDVRRMPFSRSPDLLHFRSIIANSPNLWKLCLDCAGPRWEEDKNVALEPIFVPSLRILVYSEFSVGYAMYVATQVHAPNVRDMTLMNFVGEDYTPLFVFMTERFPRVRMLTLYSVEATPGQHMVNWLASMPEIIYLRIANLQPAFLSFFLQRAELSEAQLEQQPGHLSQVVCPAISVLELQRIEASHAIAWLLHRQKLGCPIKKIYLSPEVATKMTESEHRGMASFAPMFRLEYGAKTPEEDMVLI
ncbi:hypothetical protein APHAL10511_007873 [Amanita phalloides]|nr:hypothetical protein APHAL10511_007873 [Amanita phalloides]